jgi:hypothetical protein
MADSITHASWGVPGNNAVVHHVLQTTSRVAVYVTSQLPPVHSLHLLPAQM